MLIFVYGTLLKGEPNHRVLGKSEFVRTGVTQPIFQLVSMGGFPAMVYDPVLGNTAVKGEVYAVDQQTLARLDMLEGHPTMYVRSRIYLAREPGAKHQLVVYTYLMRPHQIDGRPEIESGGWRQWNQDMSMLADQDQEFDADQESGS